MLHVVPSDVVKAIDEAFPEDLHLLWLWLTDSHRVAGVVALAHRVRDVHFANRPADERGLFIQAMATCEDLLKAWATIPREGGILGANPRGPAVGALPSLGGRTPIEVIRAVLAQCPDDAPAVTAPELVFLSDPALSEVLRLDMGIAQTTLENGEFKAACVMAGSVVEALLLWALNRTSVQQRTTAACEWDPSYKPEPDLSKWGLYPMIHVASRIKPKKLISGELLSALTAAKDFRNMIHPARAYKTKPTRGAALIAVGAMLRTAEELRDRICAGEL